MARAWVSLIIKAAISIALLVSLWFLIDVNLLMQYVRSIEPGMLLLVLLLIPISMGMRAWRFLYVINHNKRVLSFADSFRLSLVGETLNIILPASSGDIAKAYYGYRQHNIKEDMITATVLDKITGLLGLLLLGFAAAMLHGYMLLGLLFAGVALVLSVFMFVPKLIPWHWGNWLLRRYKKALDINKLRASFSMSTNVKLVATVISVGAWMVSYVHLYLITQLFSLSINPLFLFSVAPLINLSRLFPLAWAGLGVQEGVTVYLFSLVGLNATFAVVVSLIFTIATTVIPGLVGLGIILRSEKLFKK